jgi:hypothetical protein
MSSIGGFSGSTQTSLSNLYEMTRDELQGWVTAPLNTPVGYTDTNINPLLDTNPEMTRGLSEYRLIADEDLRNTAFYVQELPDGTPLDVGPLLSPVALASNSVQAPVVASEPSTSSDLGRVVFMLRGPSTITGSLVDYLWPGDTTVLPGAGSGFSSLYEYDGTGNDEPKLVGVRNEGPLKSNGEAQLISQCGTSLGSPEGGSFVPLQGSDVYNAVAGGEASGLSRVFFTAAGPCETGTGPLADELYARENLPSGKQRTISISEPSTGSTGDCTKCDTSEPSNAVYQGASEDGSRVFFLSEQRLLVGAEGESLYEYNFNAEAGKHVVLVAANMQEVSPSGELQGVARVSENGSHIYFVARRVLASEPREGCLAELYPAELVEEDTTKEGRCRPKLGGDNLYAYETASGSTAFVATLSEADEEDWRQRDLRRVNVSPDGQFLVFPSIADLTVGDVSHVRQVFEYDARTGSLKLVSHTQGETSTGSGSGEFPAIIPASDFADKSNPAPANNSLSDDGSFVVFQSEAGLTPQAARGRLNVYEYHNGVVSLISEGQAGSGVYLVGIDGSGANLFFITADRLVPQDGDTQEDMYDARIDGGFLPSAERPVCEGVGCREALHGPPQLALPGSTTQPAGEQAINPPPVRPASKNASAKKAKKTKAKRRQAGRKARARRGKKGRVDRKSTNSKLRGEHR